MLTSLRGIYTLGTVCGTLACGPANVKTSGTFGCEV